VLDRTLLIVTSDHGEQFGEHGMFGHGNSVYPNVLHVPLLIRWPGAVPAGTAVRRVVSLRDLGATILDYAGSVDFPGASLRAAIDGSRDPVSTAVAEYEGAARVAADGLRGAQTAFFDDSLQLVVLENGETELYRYREDPAASLDLSEDPAFAAVLPAFMAAHDSVVTTLRATPAADAKRVP
jgi:arylsulfatase A-like enzyme